MPDMPKSRYDRFRDNERPFGWSSPLPNRDGTLPKKWRVAHADRALVLAKRVGRNGDTYTEYESEKRRGRLMIWVGLRDNRDREAHRARLDELAEALTKAGCIVEKGDTYGKGTSHLYLVDDLAKDIMRRGSDMLRDATIRLAHEKPELREHLLPLLKTAKKVGLGTRFGWTVTETGRPLGPSGSIVYEIKKFRVPDYIDPYTYDRKEVGEKWIRIAPDEYKEGWRIDYADWSHWTSLTRDTYRTPEQAAKVVEKMYDDNTLAKRFR